MPNQERRQISFFETRATSTVQFAASTRLDELRETLAGKATTRPIAATKVLEVIPEASNPDRFALNVGFKEGYVFIDLLTTPGSGVIISSDQDRDGGHVSFADRVLVDPTNARLQQVQLQDVLRQASQRFSSLAKLSTSTPLEQEVGNIITQAEQATQQEEMAKSRLINLVLADLQAIVKNGKIDSVEQNHPLFFYRQVGVNKGKNSTGQPFFLRYNPRSNNVSLAISNAGPTHEGLLIEFPPPAEKDVSPYYRFDNGMGNDRWQKHIIDTTRRSQLPTGLRSEMMLMDSIITLVKKFVPVNNGEKMREMFLPNAPLITIH